MEKAAGGETLPSTKSVLLNLLYARHSAGKFTVVGVTDLKSLEQEYGEQIHEYLVKNYEIVP